MSRIFCALWAWAVFWCMSTLPSLALAQISPVSLAWDAPVPIALPLTGYRLWRRGSTGPWARLATVEATALRYTDLTPMVGVNCYYVSAIFATAESAGSNRVCVTRRAPSPQRLREVRR